MTTLFLLTFLLYREADDAADASEPGQVVARSCAAAEAWIRAAMKPGQSLLIHDCVPVQEAVAGR